jgi:NitT/TauT family transport system substrate-binding protein
VRKDEYSKVSTANKYECYIVCLLLLSLLTTLLSCQASPQLQPSPDEVKLQLKWIHQAQFAGFYMAQENGYYARENIKVTFMEGGENIDVIQRIASGQADFAVIAPETILMSASRGTSLVAIAAIYRLSPIVYVARADSGITRPRDFLGKTVATIDLSGSQKDIEVQFYAMMKKLDLDVSRVKVIPWDPAYKAFYNCEADVTSCYSTSGLITMRQKGLKLNLIWPSDYGIHFCSDTLVTTDRLVAQNPGLVTRFLRATLKGWQDAIEDYYKAVTVTLKYTGVKDQQFQTAMMEALLPLVYTGEDHIGWMKPADWQEMYDILLEQDLLAKPFDVKQGYTMQFLEEIHGGKSK